MKGKKEKDNLSFEEHLVRAKDIIQKLESGDCTLDEMLDMYKRGVDSLSHCSSKLNDFEKKIDIIKKDGLNEAEVKDID
jgi:exodeoxyribonuclease VII small subunit